MSFYRKEQARNVRGFCCPRPLPASSRSPSFHPFSGSFFLPSPFSPTHGSSLLSALSRERWPSIDRSPVFAAIISPNGKCFATSTPLQRSGSTRARDDDLCLLIGKVAWKRRGDTVEGTATKGLEMAENATQLWWSPGKPRESVEKEPGFSWAQLGATQRKLLRCSWVFPSFRIVLSCSAICGWIDRFGLFFISKDSLDRTVKKLEEISEKNGLINLWEVIELSSVFPSQIVGLFYKVFLLIS